MTPNGIGESRMVGKDNTEKPLATFINIVKITEVNGFDYTIHFYNSFSDKTFVFRVYKDLFDKAMKIRTVSELDIKTGEEVESEIKKGKLDGNGGLYA